MYVQIITFRLSGMTDGEFAELCEQIAPQYADVEGLVGKVFVADPDDDGAYGGVYLWHTRADADTYTRQGLAKILVTDPRFTGFSSRVLAVVPGPTAVAGGPLAGLLAETVGRPAAR